MVPSEKPVFRMKRVIALGLELTLACVIALLIKQNVHADDADSSHASVVSDYDTLLKLANRAGVSDLSDCERKLLESLSTGEFADCSSKAKDDERDKDGQNDPSKGDKWPDSRRIRAKLIEQLLVNEAALKLINSKGILIRGAKITEPVDLDNLMVPFPIVILKSRLLSPMSLRNANVRQLNLSGTWTGSVTADGLTVQGDIILRNSFHADNDVGFVNANVDGALNFEGASFNARSNSSLDASFIKVTGSIFLRNVNASGVFNLYNATVGGSLICDHGKFSNAKGVALNADHIKVAGNVLFTPKFRASGVVSMFGATVGGDLDCKGGTFNNLKADALYAASINVGGNVYLQSVKASGEVNLNDAAIGDNLKCDQATFKSISVEDARISRDLWWTSIRNGGTSGSQTRLDLTGATAANLVDDKDSWPLAGKLYLNGFNYGHFEMRQDINVPQDAYGRLSWLRRQNPSRRGVLTQPYAELANLLESEGDVTGARLVRIGMEDDLRRNRPWYGQIWPWILKLTIGYGYEPWLGVWWAFGFILFGYLSFALGYRAGIIAPTDKDAFADFQGNKLSPGYQRFNAFTYSLDTFLPIINLGLKDKWMPNPIFSPGPKEMPGTLLGDYVSAYIPHVAELRFFRSGQALRVYFWCHLLIGWVLVTLIVAGLTGIIRH
jgi:hypothetical protein